MRVSRPRLFFLSIPPCEPDRFEEDLFGPTFIFFSSFHFFSCSLDVEQEVKSANQEVASLMLGTDASFLTLMTEHGMFEATKDFVAQSQVRKIDNKKKELRIEGFVTRSDFNGQKYVECTECLCFCNARLLSISSGRPMTRR